MNDQGAVVERPNYPRENRRTFRQPQNNYGFDQQQQQRAIVPKFQVGTFIMFNDANVAQDLEQLIAFAANNSSIPPTIAALGERLRQTLFGDE